MKRELVPTMKEPPHGSVVMLWSDTGTAAQRFFNDGKWHTTTGSTLTYADLFIQPGGNPRRERRVFLIHDTTPLLGQDEAHEHALEVEAQMRLGAQK